MEDDFKELQTLLRLKKYEQPPPGYADRFLKEFHRRRRWEESRKTGFAAIGEKIGVWMASFRIPKVAYASTFGVFAAAAIAINSFMGSPVSHQIAATNGVSPRAAITASDTLTPAALTLNGISTPDLDKPLFTSSSPGDDTRPHYSFEARPASVESVSFSF